MTDKEVHKLSRRELLQLLLAQVSETEELKQLLGEREQELTTLHDNYERLRKRLDQKDATIHELRDPMRRERNARRIELQEAGSIAEAALRLNGIFEQAQKAADQYLENVRRLAEASEDEVLSSGGSRDGAGGQSLERSGVGSCLRDKNGSEDNGHEEKGESAAAAGDACLRADQGGAAEGKS